MAKVKLNLPTGVSEDKTLITCFKENNNSYIVFDAESVGSMGLPIILVCKLENNRVTKIDNPDEWTKVKGYLKEIISGTTKEYLAAASSFETDEIYYTQLTLPLASFDALKNAYNVKDIPVQDNLIVNENLENKNDLESETVEIQNSIITNNDVDSVGIAPFENVLPQSDNNVASQTPEITTSNEVSVLSSNDAVPNPLIGDNIMPNLDLSQNNNAPVQNEVNLASNEQYVIEDEKTNLENSISNVESVTSSTIDFAADRDAFLKACGNMFDALVAKFQAKYNSNNN